MTTTNDTPTAAPVLTVTWDTIIGARHVGHDPDTGPEVEPFALGDAVTEALARQLRDEMERSMRSDLTDVLRDIRDEVRTAAREQAQAMVREALTGEVRRTNHWGEPVDGGETRTLRDLIQDDVKAFLSEPDHSRDRFPRDQERKGGFRELLREEVHDALRKELRESIQAAREQVAQVVRDNAAQLIGDAVKGETR
ncbi:hypothetical protein [Pseudonocardia sp. NPDC049635]|uniref:hypothetical protein n=1 Tax=Pseudonocardia sp. NPDC049635 TaxID=3155506 RepID=UPI0033D76485